MFDQPFVRDSFIQQIDPRMRVLLAVLLAVALALLRQMTACCLGLGLGCVLLGLAQAPLGPLWRRLVAINMPFPSVIPCSFTRKRFLLVPVRQEACPPSLYPFRRLLAKGPLQRTPWALPRVLRITSRASCPRARTRSSGGLRRPGPSRSPSRPARKQSPRRRAAARPAKARAWAGWRIAGAS